MTPEREKIYILGVQAIGSLANLIQYHNHLIVNDTSYILSCCKNAKRNIDQIIKTIEKDDLNNEQAR